LASLLSGLSCLSTPDSGPRLANRAPLARAGADLATVAGAFVWLDAGASSDPDGDALSYAWNIVAGSGGGLSRPDDPKARFLAALPGTYIVELTVRDAGHLISNDIIVIDVSSQREEPQKAPRKNVRLFERQHVPGAWKYIGLDIRQVLEQEVLPQLPDGGDARTVATHDGQHRRADAPGIGFIQPPATHGGQLLLEERWCVGQGLLQRIGYLANHMLTPAVTRNRVHEGVDGAREITLAMELHGMSDTGTRSTGDG
jgi:hypothetical protein